MYSRHLVAVAICFGLTLSFCPPGYAQEGSSAEGSTPTAVELFQQGIEAYEAGEYEAARDLLQRVDPMQLPRDQRVERTQTLQALDQLRESSEAEAEAEAEDEAAEEAEAETEGEAPADTEAAQPEPEPEPEPVTPEQVLEQADEAAQAGEISIAASLYQQVARDSDADAQVRDQAQARFAEMQRRGDQSLTNARRLLDLASTDIQDGQYDQAAHRLERVEQSGVSFGWFDQQRLNRLNRVIQQYEARTEQQTQTASAQPSEDQPAEDQPAEDQPAEDQSAEGEPAEDQPEQQMASAQQPDEPAEQAPAQPEPEPQDTEQQAEQQDNTQNVQEEDAQEADVQEAQDEQESQQAEVNGDLLQQYQGARANQLVTQAREARDEGQVNLAIEMYERALAWEPQNAEQVRQELAALQAQRNMGQGPQMQIEQMTEIRRLRQQAVRARYDAAMSEAERNLATENFVSAEQSVNRAKLLLDNNDQVLPRALYEQLRQEADNLAVQITEARQLAEQRQLEDISRTEGINRERQRQQIQMERYQQVQRLLQDAMQLRLDMEYEEALQIVDRALALDPNSVAAQAMKMSIEDAMLLVEQSRVERERAVQIGHNAVENLRATIPYSDLVTYPPDWPQITERRLQSLEESSRESEANRRTRQDLQQIVPIDFDGNQFESVIDFLRSTTGANIVVNWGALEFAGVERDTLITLQLDNVRAETALQLILQQAQGPEQFDPIDYAIIEGIVHISTERDLEQTTETRVYDIRDLLVQVPNFDEPPNLDLEGGSGSGGSGRGSGGSGSGGGGGGDFGLDFDDEGDSDEDDAEEDREAMIEEITALIRDSVGRFDEWVENGGTVSSLREMNGNLIVRSTPSNHSDITDLLAQLRETRSIQISVEARFLLVDQNFLEEVGFDIDAKINDLGGEFGDISIAQDTISLGEADPTSLSPFQNTGGAGITSDFVQGIGFPASGRSFDLTASYLSDLEVNLIVKATQQHRQAISLTAPRVTFFNGQRAFVTVVRQISYVSSIEPIPDATGFEQELDYINSGVVLDVEGTVSADRRYVTLTLRPTLSSIVQIRQIRQGFDPDLDDDDDEDDEDQFQSGPLFGIIEAPELQVTAVRATVSIPDQGTLLLGGQRLVEENQVEAGVPVLSKLPFINRLFTNTSTSQDERTLLILVKPSIIIQNEREDMLFPGLQEDMEQYNIGRTSAF